MPRDLVAVNEVAKEFGVDRTTVWRYIMRNGVQTFHLLGDRRSFVDRKLIRQLLSSPRPSVKRQQTLEEARKTPR